MIINKVKALVLCCVMFVAASVQAQEKVIVDPAFPFMAGKWKITNVKANQAYDIVFNKDGTFVPTNRITNTSWSMKGDTLIWKATFKKQGWEATQTFVYERIHLNRYRGTMTNTAIDPKTGKIIQSYVTPAFIERVSEE